MTARRSGAGMRATGHRRSTKGHPRCKRARAQTRCELAPLSATHRRSQSQPLAQRTAKRTGKRLEGARA
eukprot:6176182-Pleurochrysis_carterae.AAC.1